jgi:hypothetical protein
MSPVDAPRRAGHCRRSAHVMAHRPLPAVGRAAVWVEPTVVRLQALSGTILPLGVIAAFSLARLQLLKTNAASSWLVASRSLASYREGKDDGSTSWAVGRDSRGR